jgi:hypothetical protein
VIHYRCPSCDQALIAGHEEAGSRCRCPHCGQRLQVPPPLPNRTVPGKIDDPRNRTVLGRPEQPDEPFEVDPVDEARPRRTRRDYDDEYDDFEYDRPPRRRRRRSYPPCPRCGCTAYPRQTTRFGGASITLLVIGIFFWPLIIVALFLQEKWDVCADCGEPFEQTGTGF